jgi:hypothetical protein
MLDLMAGPKFVVPQARIPAIYDFYHLSSVGARLGVRKNFHLEGYRFRDCRTLYVISLVRFAVLQGNGPVCQVEFSPEILLVCRAHLVMIVHKILAVDTRLKGVKKLPRFGTKSSNSRHRASAGRQRTY